MSKIVATTPQDIEIGMDIIEMGGSAETEIGGESKGASSVNMEASGVDELRVNALEFEAQGEFGKALAFYQQCLGLVAQEDDGTGSIAYASVLTDIGHLYKTMMEAEDVASGENATKAAKYFTQALEVQKGKYGDSHIEIATSYHNLGHVLLGIGQFDSALEKFRKSDEVWKETAGNNTIDHAQTLFAMACVLQRTGDDLSEARDALDHTLAVQVRCPKARGGAESLGWGCGVCRGGGEVARWWRQGWGRAGAVPFAQRRGGRTNTRKPRCTPLSGQNRSTPSRAL